MSHFHWRKSGTWFETCPRDDAGHCKPKGEAGAEGTTDSKPGKVAGGGDSASADDATVSGWLDSSELPPEVKDRYHATAAAVLKKMPEGLRQAALASIAASGGKVTFYADVRAVTSALEKETGKKERSRVGGWVLHHPNGDAIQVHLDGDAGSGADSAEGIYAHELGHAVDVDRKYSSDPKWESAWKREIFNGKQLLSRYARESPTEGFAELHRAIVQKGLEATRAVFPKSVAYLAAKGLL
jgi:hypothetical protein